MQTVKRLVLDRVGGGLGAKRVEKNGAQMNFRAVKVFCVVL